MAGKVLTAGDAVSLLPQDLVPGSDVGAMRSRLASVIGMTWTTELLTVWVFRRAEGTSMARIVAN